MENIAFDSHKNYTFCSVEDEKGNLITEHKIQHDRGAIRAYLSQFTPNSPVAVETIGNWYWIVDEIEQAGMIPRLVHAGKAKLMFGCVNKTDRLDARGLNRLQRIGSLPTVWIPPHEIRDKRDISRTRLFLVFQRTRLKNRIHAVLKKYALGLKTVKDPYCKTGRVELKKLLARLPDYTRFATEMQLLQIDSLDPAIAQLEVKMKMICKQTEEVRLLQTMPGIGNVLSNSIQFEVGDISRFSGPGRMAAYSGTTPRVHSSGGKTRFGKLRQDVNHYLKWAYIEAANLVCINMRNHPNRFVSKLFKGIKQRKGHAPAVGAVARHLAEATYWVLTKHEPYREPRPKVKPSTAA
jgi:transposase